MMLYQVRVAIYEASTPKFPIVVHLFQGKTRDEAIAYHTAHRKYDEFLRSCEDRQCFLGQVPCSAVITEGWVRV